MNVTISFEAADEIFNLLRAYDSTLDLGFPDKSGRAFQELRRELARCREEQALEDEEFERVKATDVRA